MLAPWPIGDKRTCRSDLCNNAVSGSQGENHRRELDQANLRQLGTHTYLALKASGRRIELERYVPPREAGGREAFFLFPRTREGKD